jgi:hypothetical protein
MKNMSNIYDQVNELYHLFWSHAKVKDVSAFTSDDQQFQNAFGSKALGTTLVQQLAPPPLHLEEIHM